MMRWKWTLAALERLPQGALSRAFGRLADIPIPLRRRSFVLGTFARMVGIDASQAELPIDEYESINKFFVRKLAPGMRSWPADPGTIGSPVEGIVGQFGRIKAGTLLQAKGMEYTLGMLLDDQREARHFDNGGSYITLYLSPRHYHRIHTPVAGKIERATHIPGHLFPVNAPSVAYVDELFVVNERLICFIDSNVGRVAIVAIGAYNVGRISAAFDPRWSQDGWITNKKNAAAETKTYAPPVAVARGDEIMAFHLGSTVIALFEPHVEIDASLKPEMEILLGQTIASSS